MAAGTSVASARQVALTVVRRVFEQDAYADRALNAEAAGLDPRERAFATQLAYGTVQRRATLDHVAGQLVSRDLDALEPGVLAVLRLGLFQLLFMGGVADHAAVNESVDLAKRVSRGGSGLVNAVLRRAAGGSGELLADLHDRTPEAAAILYSVPEWLAELWWAELGPEEARRLLQTINQPAESALRVNTLVASPEEIMRELPGAHTAADIPQGIVLDAPFDVHGSEPWRSGAIMPQSRGSMLVSRTLAPVPGDHVLDLCAAPGGKTTHLAALMGNEGSILAIERHPGRAQALERTCARMGASIVRVEVGDATVPRSAGPGAPAGQAAPADHPAFAAQPRPAGETPAKFDRVLVDPPCSGLGTLQSRPDLRWRVTPDSIAELAELQDRILAAGAEATRPGGVLVYSVCTISRAESREVVDRLLAERPDFQLESEEQLLPSHDGTDGFYIARLCRVGGSLP